MSQGDDEQPDNAPLLRVSSGSPGLDSILYGGLFSAGLYLVIGPPGSGKTILGNQFCFHHVAQGGRAVYVTLLSEAHGRMLKHLQSMRFFHPEEVGRQVYYVSGYATLKSEGLAGLTKLLYGVVRERHATAMVVDGLSAAESVSENKLAFREFIHNLGVHNGMAGCTTLLLSNERPAHVSDPEHAMVDGIIALGSELFGQRQVRGLEVMKSRGSPQRPGKHNFEITSDGIVAYPRAETVFAGASEVDPELDERVPFGSPNLDKMVGGGLLPYSTTLAMGSPGGGKTTLGLKFLLTGAESGEPGLYFGFSEAPRRLVRKAKMLGMNLEPHLKAGRLFIEARMPVEALTDALIHELITLVERHRIRRLVIDGLEPLAQESVDSGRTPRLITALTNALRDRRVTTLFTQQTNLLFGPELQAPMQSVEAIVDNILLMRQVELRSEIHRLMLVLKMRESEHDFGLRELRVGGRDVIEVGEKLEAADSLITGVGKPLPQEQAKPPKGKRVKKLARKLTKRLGRQGGRRG